MDTEKMDILDKHGNPVSRRLPLLRRLTAKTKALMVGIAAALAFLAGVAANIERIASLFKPDREGYEAPVSVYVEPIEYTPSIQRLEILKPGIQRFKTLEPRVTRSLPTSVSNLLYIDAVVSQFNQVFFIDLRIANQSDKPQLISAIKLTATSVKSYDREMLQRRQQEKLSHISRVYDISLSDFRGPGDSITEILSQVLEPRSTDRFVIRLSASPPMDVDNPGAVRGIHITFDAEITTSAGLIVLEDLNATFSSGGVELIHKSAGYYKELMDLAER